MRNLVNGGTYVRYITANNTYYSEINPEGVRRRAMYH